MHPSFSLSRILGPPFSHTYSQFVQSCVGRKKRERERGREREREKEARYHDRSLGDIAFREGRGKCSFSHQSLFCLLSNQEKNSVPFFPSFLTTFFLFFSNNFLFFPQSTTTTPSLIKPRPHFRIWLCSRRRPQEEGEKERKEKAQTLLLPLSFSLRM
jgi:hypothetical protein